MDDQVKNKEWVYTIRCIMLFQLINIIHRNEENLSDKPVNEEVKTKPFLKMRRRSLSPFSRVQTMIDAKNTDKNDISNKDPSKY